MTKAVIFDMDGTIADTDPFIKNAIKKRLSELGLPLSHIKSGKCTLIDFWTDIKEKHSLSEPVESLVHKTREIYWATLKGIKPLPGVVELIKLLKARKIKIGLASGASPRSINSVLTELNLISYFDVIVSTHDVAHPKPLPDVYVEAARRLHVHPSECIAIEDERKGIAAAKAAGMKCIGVKACATEELYADILVENLDKFEVNLL